MDFLYGGLGIMAEIPLQIGYFWHVTLPYFMTHIDRGGPKGYHTFTTFHGFGDIL